MRRGMPLLLLAAACTAPVRPAPVSPPEQVVAAAPASAKSDDATAHRAPADPPASAAAAPREADDGESRVAATTPTGPRLTSIAYKTWIWPSKKAEGRFLGYVRVGESVALKSTKTEPGIGCPRGFFAIEPHGYVCRDRTVTLAKTTPFLEANAHTRPEKGPFPYRFALSNYAPMYSRVPTAAEQKKNEWIYGEAGKWVPLSMFQKGHEHLAVSTPIAAADAMPDFLADGGSARPGYGLVRRSIPHGSMLAFTRAFDVGGRTFLLSTDLTVVPADRVREFRRSDFAGLELSGDDALPIAWFRRDDKVRYRRDGDTMVATEARYPVRTSAKLTGASHEHDGQRFLEVESHDGRERGWVAANDATVVEHYGKRPFGVKEGDKWVLVSITDGTLVAYDDLTPVFTTLISPGQGGVPRRGGDPVKDSTTPLGIYKITFKDRAATMSPEMGEDRSFWIADVPFTQYFDPPFALHGAYWHERFGEPMSAGCINLSLRDAAYLFDWTDPIVPDGWQGATGVGAKENGPASWVVVRR